MVYTRRHDDTRRTIAALVWFVLIAFVVVTLVRIFVAQPFIVTGVSMSPAFQSNEYLVIDKVYYHFHTPKRGDVLIFQYPLDPSYYFIKRVVGIPGESISVSQGVVTVVDKKGKVNTLEEPYVVAGSNKKDSPMVTLMDDEYFVMGDNRDESSDSREWGPLQKKFIVGRALLGLYPLSDIRLYPGAYAFGSVK